MACADKGTFSHLAWVDRPAGFFAKKREERENAWKIMGPREIGKEGREKCFRKGGKAQNWASFSFPSKKIPFLLFLFTFPCLCLWGRRRGGGGGGGRGRPRISQGISPFLPFFTRGKMGGAPFNSRPSGNSRGTDMTFLQFPSCSHGFNMFFKCVARNARKYSLNFVFEFPPDLQFRALCQIGFSTSDR